MNNFESYAERQRKFWNTDNEKDAQFARVDTVSEGDEAKYTALANSTGDLLLSDVSPQPEWTLLEIGCGVGRMIQQMQKRIQFTKFYGLDISQTMIDYAGKNTGGDPRLSLHVNSGYDLSAVPNTIVDYAYAVDVFIHIFDAEIINNYVKEAARTLKKGGLFRFDVRHHDPSKSFGNSLGGLFAKWSYKLGLRSAATHRWQPGEEAEFNGNKFTDNELRAVVRASGLTVLSTFVRAEDTHLWCLARKD